MVVLLTFVGVVFRALFTLMFGVNFNSLDFAFYCHSAGTRTITRQQQLKALGNIAAIE